MRIYLFFTFCLLLGNSGAAQELVGPDRLLPGTLASFEIVPAQEASWHIVSPSLESETCQVDTGLSKLYFASPEQGRYSLIAGIVVDGRPILLTKTFINGGYDVAPLPDPVPPVSSLETWIKTQIPALVKSKNLVSESRLVADCFNQIIRRIEEGNIQTVQNVRAQLQIMLTGTLALASPTAVTDWTVFLAALSRQLDKELGERINDLTEVKKVFQKVCGTMKLLELPESHSSLKTPLRESDAPNNRGTQNRSVQNRTFRNLLSN